MTPDTKLPRTPKTARESTIVGAEPRITKRYHAGNVLAVTPWTVGGTLGLAALGIAAVLAAGRRGARDEVYLGLGTTIKLAGSAAFSSSAQAAATWAAS